MRQRKGNCQYFQILEEEGHNDSTLAIGRISRSTVFVSSSSRPSSRNSTNPRQWRRA